MFEKTADYELNRPKRNKEWWEKLIPENLGYNDYEAMRLFITTRIFDKGSAQKIDPQFPKGWPIKEIQKLRTLGSPEDIYASTSLRLMMQDGWKFSFAIDVSGVQHANAVNRDFGDLLIRIVFSVTKNMVELACRVGGDELAIMVKDKVLSEEEKKALFDQIKNELNAIYTLYKRGNKIVSHPVNIKYISEAPNTVVSETVKTGSLMSTQEKVAYLVKHYPKLSFIQLFQDAIHSNRYDDVQTKQVADVLEQLVVDPVTQEAKATFDSKHAHHAYIERDDVLDRLEHEQDKEWSVVRVDILGVLKYINDVDKDATEEDKKFAYLRGNDFIKSLYVELHNILQENNFLDDGFQYHKGSDWYIFLPKQAKDTLMTLQNDIEALSNVTYNIGDGRAVPLLTAVGTETFKLNPRSLWERAKDAWKGRYGKKEVTQREHLSESFAHLQNSVDKKFFKSHQKNLQKKFKDENFVEEFHDFLWQTFNPGNDRALNRLYRIFPKQAKNPDIANTTNMHELISELLDNPFSKLMKETRNMLAGSS